MSIISNGWIQMLYKARFPNYFDSYQRERDRKVSPGLTDWLIALDINYISYHL